MSNFGEVNIMPQNFKLEVNRVKTRGNEEKRKFCVGLNRLIGDERFVAVGY